jgi:hypothetical protein
VLAGSGLMVRYLRQHSRVGQPDLLDHLDTLIYGSYIAAHHTNLLWHCPSLADPGIAARDGCDLPGAPNRAIQDPLIRWLAWPGRQGRPMRMSPWTSAAKVAPRPSMKHGKR